MKFNKIILYLIILFTGYGAILFIPVGKINIAIPVIYESSEILWTTLPLSMLLDILITPPFVLIMIYYIYKAITEQPLFNKAEPSQRQRDIIRILLYGAAIVFVAGVIMHAVCNQLNGILGNPKPPTSAFEITVYFFDEVLGHKLIHFALITFFIGLMFVQYWHRKKPELGRWEELGLYFWASIAGTIYAISAIEGQAGFDMLVISVCLCMIILYCLKFKGLNLRENIFTYFILVFLIALAVTTIIYGMIIGFKLGYPFFYQPSEL